MITAGDIAYLQSCYPHAQISPLSVQQEQFVLYVLRGLTPTQSAKAAGYAHPSTEGSRLMGLDKISLLLQHFRDEELSAIKVTRDNLTVMLYEAHRKSANSTEEIAAIRELGKMHGVYEAEKTESVQIHKVEQLERLDDAELIKLAAL